MKAIIHSEGDQLAAKQSKTVEIALKQLAETWQKEYNDARKAYITAIAKEMTASSVYSTLDTAYGFTMAAQKMIAETHRQLANSLSMTGQFNSVYR